MAISMFLPGQSFDDIRFPLQSGLILLSGTWVWWSTTRQTP